MIFEDILPSLKNYNTLKKIMTLHSEIVLLNRWSQRMKATLKLVNVWKSRICLFLFKYYQTFLLVHEIEEELVITFTLQEDEQQGTITVKLFIN